MYLQLENIVRQWRGKRVLVIGDAMLDVDMPVVGEGPSPEYRGARVLQVAEGMPMAGGAANVAANLAAMGAQPHLLSVVGADSNAHHLGACLNGISSFLVDDMDRPTTTKTRLGKRVRLDCESTKPLPRRVVRDMKDDMEEHVPNMHAIILSDYGKGVLCPEVLAKLARMYPRCPVVWDPKHVLHPQLRGTITHATPNLAELRALAGVQLRTKARRKLGERLGRRTTLVMTEGERGAVIRRHGQECRVHTERVKHPDVRGAGDTFVAAFTLGLATGADVLRATALGHAAARQAVLTKGTAVVTSEELLKHLAGVAGRNRGLLLKQLQAGML